MTVKQAVKLTRNQRYDQVKTGKLARLWPPRHPVHGSQRCLAKNRGRVGGHA